MPTSLDPQIRADIISLWDRGVHVKAQIAARLKINRATVRKVLIEEGLQAIGDDEEERPAPLDASDDDDEAQPTETGGGDTDGADPPTVVVATPIAEGGDDDDEQGKQYYGREPEGLTPPGDPDDAPPFRSALIAGREPYWEHDDAPPAAAVPDDERIVPFRRSSRLVFSDVADRWVDPDTLASGPLNGEQVPAGTIVQPQTQTLGAPMVLGINIEIPIEIIQLHNSLMAQQNYAGSLNDFIVETIEDHWADCVGLRIVLAAGVRRAVAVNGNGG